VKHQPTVSAVLPVLRSMSADALETADLGFVARTAGVSRRSVSRALGELEKSGIIETEWRRSGKRGGVFLIRLNDELADALD
jgi:DNA-binding transcriptional ArsR family regulator